MKSLSLCELYSVAEATGALFEDQEILEGFSAAHRAMQESTEPGAALEAFASSIAPVLLNERHKTHTFLILRTLGKDTAGDVNTIRDLFSVMLLDKDYAALAAAIRQHGVTPVLSALYKYGVPPTIRAISAFLDEEAERQRWEIYVADTCAALLRAVVGKNCPKFPSYSDLIKKTPQDNRSGKEILESIKNTLKRRKEKRK